MGNPTFVLYFFGVVLVVAGLGVWITLVRYAISTLPEEKLSAIKNFLETSSTYAIALSATALADVVLSKKYSSAFGAITLVVFILVCCAIPASFLGPFLGYVQVGLVITVVCVVLSLYQWWLINCDNSALADDSINPTDATGGNPL